MIRFIVLALVALLSLAAPAAAQDYTSKLNSYLSTASNNSTLVYGDKALVKTVTVINTTATAYYLKLYDKRTAPTCGTDTPVYRIPVPPQSTGGGVVPVDLGSGEFQLGVGFCLVANLADNDNTNAATGVAINLSVVPR